MRRTLATLTVALAVVLAGCAGGVSPGGAGATTDGGAGTGTVHFYVSDRPAAIDSFDHLNVTVSRVGFHASENETAADAEDAEDGDDGESAGDGEWLTREVDNATVDLTELRGANASLLDEFELPNGTYDETFVYVSDVNGTLTSGDSARVKLPSGKLKIQTPMTVGDGSATDFVFDIAVHEAGKSGKYVLRPVVSESGTQVQIRDVDDDHDREDGEHGDHGEHGDDHREHDDDGAAALSATFEGNVTPGANATLVVTDANGTVANATVAVDGETVGTTGEDGTLVLGVPEEELEVTVTAGDRETELEREFENYTES